MKTKFLLLTNIKQTSILMLFVGLLMVVTKTVTGQYTNTRIFDKSPVLLNKEAPNGWYPDRHAPSGFTVASPPNTYPTALKESISSADASLNRSDNDPFYNTQGRSMVLPSGTIEVSARLYIP